MKLAAAQTQLASKRKKKEAVDPTNAEIKKLKFRCEKAEASLSNAYETISNLRSDYKKVRFLGFEWTRKIN